MKPDQISNLENKESIPETKIELHFFRHSIKSKEKIENDNLVPLSDEGRKFAIKNAYKDTNHAQAVAFGTSRIRAQETAGFVMAGSREDITGDETLEELKEKLNENLNAGSKIGINENLNFFDDSETPLGKALIEAYGRGEYVKFIVEESDRIAKETGDTSRQSYAEKAAAIAKVIERYVKISPRWQKLIERKATEENSTVYTPVLERYLGTHQGMQESFLAKLIEKTEGIEARDKFVKVIGGHGFNYIEGFDVSIENAGNISKIKISYNKDMENGTKYAFEKMLSPNELNELFLQ